MGRGPLAGPVVAAVAWFTAPPPDAVSRLVDDSKRLDVDGRLAADRALRSLPTLRFAVSAASTVEIDRLNVLVASLLAMRRAVLRLPDLPDLVLVDGNRAPVLPCAARCVVGGDALSLSIAAASILAKVTRDRAMERLARRWPGYGWERNAGYPTAEHRAALSRLGTTPHHRRSFGPVRAIG